MPKLLRTLFVIGRTAYEFVQEFRHEQKQDAKRLAESRRIQSARYQEASHVVPRDKLN